MSDFAKSRTMMVDTQVRPSDVTKFPIIEAMLHVPRERFVPGAKRGVAYVGENLEIAKGRMMLEPRTLAKMLDALDIQPSDLVLDVGCGLGYSTAVIARMAEAVVGVESDADMVRDAQAALSAVGADNAIVVECPLAGGAPKHGPYDVVVIEGAAEVVPQAILDQIKPGGRIACVFLAGALGVARIGRKAEGGSVSWRDSFNAAAPVLPGFAAAKSFVL